MTFVSTDPRSRLSTLGPKNAPVKSFGQSSYAKFYETEPQIEVAGERSWVGRGQHFVVVYSECAGGSSLVRSGERDEYFVLLPDPSSSVSVEAGGVVTKVAGNSVAILPPGDSRIDVASDTVLVRVFTSSASDLVAVASNADSYMVDAPNLDPLEAWPEPSDGYRTRVYSLDVADVPERFGRIWRTRCLMINYSYPRPGPRDVRKMSPHTHEGFEQGSLCLSGTFVHHLRWPWGTDARIWQQDEHEICAGPSLAVIPALVLHTSQQCGVGINQLVDIFAPPRADFSAEDGWVLNADEYPKPVD